jgi:transketolase
MTEQAEQLKKKAAAVRAQVFEMIVAANKGHIGGAFSCTDLLVALYYGGILNVRPAEPLWPARDRFILSKGHSCEALYAVLADKGFFPSAELMNYQKRGCILGGHPDRRVPGIEADTGSLGHGLGLGVGMALAAKMNRQEYLTVVLLGDGECCEGSVWEAAMFASKHRLRNLVAIVDHNGLCVTDALTDCTAVEPLAQKWRAFDWDVREINGHDFEQILSALADVRHRSSDRPLMIVARTVKGKGVSYMENQLPWHHGVPKGELVDRGRRELGIKNAS